MPLKFISPDFDETIDGEQALKRLSARDHEKEKKQLVEDMCYMNQAVGKRLEASGTKHDQGKLRMDLIPASSLQALASVLSFGAGKYGDHNWKKGLPYSRIYAACMRHLIAFWGGQDLDEESGLPHLHHAMCNLAFLIEFTKSNPKLDDRQNG